MSEAVLDYDELVALYERQGVRIDAHNTAMRELLGHGVSQNEDAFPEELGFAQLYEQGKAIFEHLSALHEMTKLEIRDFYAF